MPPTPFVEALTLFVVIAYVLSLAIGVLPISKGDLAHAVRESRRRLLLPPVGALCLVTMGLWPHFSSAFGVVAPHPWITLAETFPVALLHHVAAAVVAVWAACVVWNAYNWARSLQRLKKLESFASPAREVALRADLATLGVAWPGALSVVAFDRPLCFVYGLRRPRLMVSTAAVDGLNVEELRAIIAHERAHLDRRDHWWRLAGHLAVLVHVPGIGARALARWSLASEAACDAAAARSVGSSTRVAEALVRFRRLAQSAGGCATTPWVTAFEAGGMLEQRVGALLAPPAASAAQRMVALWPLMVAALIVWQQDTVHMTLESILRLVHG